MNWYKKSQINFDFSQDGKLKEIKIGDTVILYSVHFETGDIKINSIRTPRDKRNHGSARKAMEIFLKEIDKQGKKVTLDSSPLDRRTNDERLFNFYKSLGFIPTGYKINPIGDPRMERLPKS